MTSEEPLQLYTVELFYEDRLRNEVLHEVIDWKMEVDMYWFFQNVPDQVRPRITTQWLKAPGLVRLCITPVGPPVPYHTTQA